MSKDMVYCHFMIILLNLLCVFIHFSSADHVPRLLLISFDGFRWDYLSKVNKTPNFDRVISGGVKAKWIQDSYTSLTFPNHYTIVTGLYEESHGIVANEFYDPDLDMVFQSHNRTTVQDGRFWGGEPIWVTNQIHGGRSGVFYWVGSEAEIKGYRPTHYVNYTKHNASMELWKNHTDTVFGWMTNGDEPVDLALLYFKEPDHTGHIYGPDSPQVKAMIQQCDNITGYILDQVEAYGLTGILNVIITSDHGMTNMDKSRFITLDGHYDKTKTNHFLNYVIGASIWPEKGFTDQIYHNLSGINENVKVWKKSDIPPEYHYSNNKRIPPVLMAADEGWGIKDNWKNPNYLLGRHGFNNSEMDMHPFFLATGPAFKKGLVSEPFENIHIYELMCNILGVKPAPNNGSLQAIQHLLADDGWRIFDDRQMRSIIRMTGICVGAALCVMMIILVAQELFKPYWKKSRPRNHSDSEGEKLLSEV